MKVEVLGRHFYWLNPELTAFQRAVIPHKAWIKVLHGATMTDMNAWFKRLSFRPKVAHNSEVRWHCGGHRVPPSQRPERWAAEAPGLVSAEASGASSVTEWVLERQAEKWRVTVKVNKIKAGNLRASVPHKRCRQQREGSVKDKGGWEDYRVCASMCAHACVFVRIW